MKERNVGIDFLKCIAALLITNSHMGMLYGSYSFLATGGCIGDVLFFFCSGFTLFLKPMKGVKEFPNWYKKRVNRIYPTVFAVAIMACLFFNSDKNIIDIILHGGGWFVSCIMIYYIAIHFVGSYLKNNIYILSFFIALATAVWFYFACQIDGFSIYGGHYIRWLLFFDFMLLGAKMGTITEKIKCKPVIDIVLLVVSVVCFYALFILGTKYDSFVVAQYFSFLPLLCVVYYLYKVGSNKWMEKVYHNKIGNFIVRFIGGLCLEIYLVQFFLFTDKMNHLFPLNILIMFLIIFVVAYLVRCLARFLSQTFKDSPYDWYKIIDLY